MSSESPFSAVTAAMSFAAVSAAAVSSSSAVAGRTLTFAFTLESLASLVSTMGAMWLYTSRHCQKYCLPPSSMSPRGDISANWLPTTKFMFSRQLSSSGRLASRLASKSARSSLTVCFSLSEISLFISLSFASRLLPPNGRVRRAASPAPRRAPRPTSPPPSFRAAARDRS